MTSSMLPNPARSPAAASMLCPRNSTSMRPSACAAPMWRRFWTRARNMFSALAFMRICTSSSNGGVPARAADPPSHEVGSMWIALDAASAWSRNASGSARTSLRRAVLTFGLAPEGPGAGIVAMYTSEVNVHTWDLATATGQRPVWNDASIEMSLFAMQQGLPAHGRIEEFEAVRANMPEGEHDFEYPFAEAVSVPSDALLIDQLVAWTGRTPR